MSPPGRRAVVKVCRRREKVVSRGAWVTNTGRRRAGGRGWGAVWGDLDSGPPRDRAVSRRAGPGARCGGGATVRVGARWGERRRAVLAARSPGPSPRLEHEGGPGGRRCEQGALVEDEEVPIEELADSHDSRHRSAFEARRDPHAARAEADSVAAGDDERREATAQEAVEVARRWAPGGGGVGGRPRKRRVQSARNSGRKASPASRVLMPRSRSRWSGDPAGCPRASDSPLGWGEWSRTKPMPRAWSMRPKWAGPVALELFGERPVAVIRVGRHQVVAEESHGEAIRATGAVRTVT